MSRWPPAGTDLWTITAPAIRFGLLRDLRIMNAHAVWMFHGRAYAGGRFVSCIVMLPWVRLEALPFHIPPRIALLGWLGCFGFGCVDELRVGEGRCVLPW